MIYKGAINEYLQLEVVHSNKCFQQKETLESPLIFIWFQKSESSIQIDNVDYRFKKNQIISLTEFHKVDISGICNARMIRFNRPFYCVVDHDYEVGCKGILFFGASKLPVIDIPDTELEKFNTIWRMFEIEMNSKDDLQLEMLQTMLKRFIILCTRIYKTQENYKNFEDNQITLIREYNFLVEKHFRTKHTVAEYAELLNKSPKTLSNLFTKLSDKTPLQFIQERKILEARRLLSFSEMSVKEIAFKLGYEDLQAFGRFFKKQEGISPTQFRDKIG